MTKDEALKLLTKITLVGNKDDMADWLTKHDAIRLPYQGLIRGDWPVLCISPEGQVAIPDHHWNEQRCIHMVLPLETP